MAVHGHGRKRLLVAKDAVERLARRRHGRVGQVGLVIHRREAAREQELIALAQRNVERTRQRQQHLATRARPSDLDEAEVAR